MSVFLIDDAVSTDPIEALLLSAKRVEDTYRLMQNSHLAEMTWVLSALKGIIATWGETEILNAVTKERVQHLATALGEEIEDKIR